jgi:hypothetical protein
VGRAPSARIDAPAIPDILDLLVDAQGQVWALGSSRDQEGRPRLALAVFDADLRLRWRWDAPAQRPVERWSGMARLAAEVVLVARFADGQSALLFFDSQGSLREQATSVREPLALAALGDKLLVMDRPSVNEANSLTILDASGAVRFAAPRSWFDGFARWVHTAHADASVSLFSGFEGVLSWRRAVPPADLATGSASVLWTRQLALGPVDAAGAAALGEDVLVWGSLREQRANWSAGFPWVAQLSGDGSVRFQWSNGRLSTPGQVRDAVQTSAGITCTGGDESWEDELPAPGPRCSPDGCNALTVRCFDTGGKELWKYHHRSERSEAYSLATDNAGRRLYVAGNITRDLRRSTGSRAVLMRFEL